VGEGSTTSTQKPAAHLCGRVLDEAIDYDQNTITDRTSQAAIKLVFHSSQDRRSLESMTAFTKGERTKVHHLDRDPEFLIELPERIQIHRILVNRQDLNQQGLR